MNPEVSIIVPVMNEAGNIQPMVREVTDAMSPSGRSYELVFVDDGSTDDTFTRITEARAKDTRVRGLRHARNLGQSAALWTGIQATRSPLLATLDGDLQNDPAELPRLLALLAEADLVCGVRVKRQDTWVRKASARVAFWARRAVLGVDLKDVGCGLRAFRRTALDGVFGFNGLHRFLPVLLAGAGQRVREVPVNHRARLTGVSKYGVWNRLGRGIADLFAIAWYQRRRLGRAEWSEPGAAPGTGGDSPAGRA